MPVIATNKMLQAEIEQLSKTVSNLESQLEYHQHLLIALMSELPEHSLKNFTPFDLALRNYFSKLPVNSDQLHNAAAYINKCIEDAEQHNSESDVS